MPQNMTRILADGATLTHPTTTDNKVIYSIVLYNMNFVLAAQSAARALRDPTRQDMIATLAETTGTFKFIRDKMLLSKEGRRILRERPLVNSQTINIDHLSTLSSNSFGFKYSHFLKEHQVSPDTRVPVKYISDPELAYVALRYRQVHDFWHTLLQLDVSVKAEITLKWFEMVQLGLPMNFLSAIFGPLRLDSASRRSLISESIPWALRSASTSVFLMNVMCEDYFQMDMSQFQKELRLEPFKIKI